MRTRMHRAILLACLVVVLTWFCTGLALAHLPGGGEPGSGGSGGTGNVGSNQGGGTCSGDSSPSPVNPNPNGGGTDWTKWIPEGKDYDDAKKVYNDFGDFIPDKYKGDIDTAIGAKDAIDSAKDALDKAKDWFTGGGGLSDAERKALQAKLRSAQTYYQTAQAQSFSLGNQKNDLVNQIWDLRQKLNQADPGDEVKVGGKVITYAYVAQLQKQYESVKAKLAGVQQEINQLSATIKSLRGKLGM